MSVGQRGTQSQQRGFTLIQISIMLTVAALVMVAMLPSSQVNLTNNTASMSKMNAVLTAVRNYEAAQGSIPCPADASIAVGSTNYGIAAANAGTTNNCGGGTPAANFTDSTNHVAIGMVPVRTLGLSNDYAQDAYGRDITYAVDTNATSSCWSSGTLPGTIQVIDGNGKVTNSVIALVSHGADGHGAWLPMTNTANTATRLNTGSTDKDQNMVNAHAATSSTFPSNYASINTLVATSETDSGGNAISATFVKKLPTGSFDDIVVYQNPQWLLNKLPAGTRYTVIPPANGNYTYASGNKLIFTVQFSGNVTYTGGTPQLDLSAIANTANTATLGPSSNRGYATYVSGNGTNTFVFSYTILTTDYAPNGISLTLPIDVTANSSTLNTTASCYNTPALSGIVVNASTLWVSDTTQNRVQQYTSSGTYLQTIGPTSANGGCTTSPCAAGIGNYQFSAPKGVAVDLNGNVWVSDSGNNRLQEYSSGGVWIQQVPASGCSGTSVPYCTASSSTGKFSAPLDVTVDSGGNIWVVDSGNYRIEKLTTANPAVYSSSIGSGSSGASLGQFALNNTFSGIAVSGSNVWVSDAGNSRVEEYSGSSWVLSPNVTFSSPAGLALDASGNLWVSDSGNSRYREFNSSGTSVTTLGTSGSGSGQFSTPRGVFVDPATVNNVWLADYGNHRIQEFSYSGGSWVYTSQFGLPGTGAGGMNGPYGIALTGLSSTR